MEPEHDFHAGMMETSMMMYWAPELVRDEIEVGVMGLPELASVEIGEKIANEMVDNLCAFVDKLEEKSNEN